MARRCLPTTTWRMSLRLVARLEAGGDTPRWVSGGASAVITVRYHLLWPSPFVPLVRRHPMNLAAVAARVIRG